jgi:hypothetical protein
VSGQQYTLGFTAIAIHFQAVTNFVLFLYQIFILPGTFMDIGFFLSFYKIKLIRRKERIKRKGP